MLTYLVVLSNLVLVCFGANPYLKRKPDFVNTCQFADPNFVKCNTAQVQQFFAHLSAGIPEINLMPLDPLKITKIDIISGEGPVSIDLALNNVTVRGFKDAIVEYNSVDPKTYEFTTKLRIPRLLIEGLYESKGRILIIPLNGHGDCFVDCHDMTVDAKCDVKLYKRRGHYFFNVTAAHVDFELGGLKLQLNNLFEGNKELEQGTNKYLNQNWKEIAAAFKPVLGDTIQEILLSILSQFFHNVPAEYFESDIQ